MLIFLEKFINQKIIVTISSNMQFQVIADISNRPKICIRNESMESISIEQKANLIEEEIWI
jgi:hypothetical protein